MSYYEFHVARRYVQFGGALRELANYLTLVGRKVLLITACDPVRGEVVACIKEGIALPAAQVMDPALAAESPRYARYLPMADRFDRCRREMTFEFYDIGDCEVTEEHVRNVGRYVTEGGFDTVVGIGGGKGQDFARALTHAAPVKTVLVPTLCATNASISTLSVLYTPDGRIDRYWRMDNAPDLVLVDTDLIVRNPPWALAAGIGDITATYYEAQCNLRMSGRTDHIPAYSAEGIGLNIRLMRSHAPAAMAAIRTRRADPSFETVLSMIMHNPGPLGMICLTGFAHIVDEVFLYFDAAHLTPHGLRVGFAVIAMLLFEGAGEDEIREYLAFCRSVGIPVTLKELKLDGIGREEWLRAYDATVGKSGSVRGLPFEADGPGIVKSILEADRCAALLM